MIDVIIPVLNEEKLLNEHRGYYQSLGQKAHLIFVDGGSNDRTSEIAKDFGEVVFSQRGRAHQKNAGAAVAKTDYLCFLHIDTLIEKATLEAIEKVLSNGACGGCLTMVIKDKAFLFRIFERLVNFRAKAFKVLDGDLSQFVRRDVFERIDGYDPVPVLEDIFLSKKLKKAGKIEVLPDVIKVSSRKWHEKGFGKLFLQYLLIYLRLWTGQVK